MTAPPEGEPSRGAVYRANEKYGPLPPPPGEVAPPKAVTERADESAEPVPSQSASPTAPPEGSKVKGASLF